MIKKILASAIVAGGLLLGGCMFNYVEPPHFAPGYGPYENKGSIGELPKAGKEDGFEFSAGIAEDGVLQLYITNAFDSKLNLYEETSNGVFNLEGVLTTFPLQHGHEGVAAARWDWDNDGLVDFLRISSNTGNIVLNRNLGDGTYRGIYNANPMVVATLPSQPWDSPVAMDMADWVNKGSPDIVFVAIRPPICCKGIQPSEPIANIKLYKNDGNGNFTYSGILASVPLPDINTKFEIAAVDYDGDGDVDLLFKQADQENVILLENVSIP